MKQYIAIILLGLGMGRTALAGPSPLWANYGFIDTPPVVDATTFYNAGEISVTTVTGLSITNILRTEGEFGAFSSYPFMTKDTLNWTNASSGFMEGTPGFEFDTATSTSRHNSSSFVNAGTMIGLDQEAIPYLFATIGAATPPVTPVPALSGNIPSQLLVLATNILNTGIMTVGNCGLLSLTGNNVTNSYATLVAGSVNTAGLVPDPLDTTGLQGEESVIDGAFNNGPYYYVPSPGVADLFWGITNALTIDLTGFDPPNDVDNIPTRSLRGYGFTPFFPINLDTGQYSVSAVLTGDATGTNFYYNIVFVNTNFSNTNLFANVGFTSVDAFLDYDSTTVAINQFALEAIVQIAEPVYDIVTGQTVTNGIYLIDDGAILPTMSLAQNASEPGSSPSNGDNRPNAFEITTETPFEWADALEVAASDAFPYEPDLLWTNQEFMNQKVPFEISEYGAQIGHNPADLTGSFASLLDTNAIAADELIFLPVNLPDPTNQPGRIEITAGNLDITQSKLRSEGMVILNVSNLVGGGTALEDWGEMNASIGATNGALVVSNFFPTTFNRVRGDIYAWSATWANVQTNLGSFANSNNPAPVTNNIFYHVLIVDQNIFGSFPSTVRNLTLNSKDSIVLQDNLNVINQVAINTSNLTINGSTFFSQNAATFTPSFTPTLKNLFISPTGFLGAANTLDLGFNVNDSVSSPTGRKYTINSITNFGQMAAVAPLLQSAVLENDGVISAEDGGSIIIEANTLALGQALPGTTNFIDADANVYLSAANIEASNSVIAAGLTENASLTLDATEKLTDFVPGVPATNTNSAIMNFWSTTAGFSLPVKPATGDLFGTEITTISSNAEPAIHVWAGTDLGPVNAGFTNNEVIGRLVLDRLSTAAVLRFSAAGAANAMYVDYLQLTNFSLSDYRHGLVIDPNFTIYFADSNLDPEKLMEVYPRLVWVQSFAGPNSTQIVPYLNSSNVCYMNAALAQSSEISFFNGVANFYNQPYVLNNPNNPTNYLPCPGDEITTKSLLVATPVAGESNALNLNLVNVYVNGLGTVSSDLKPGKVVFGNAYTLTATPAKGWLFENWSGLSLPNSALATSHILSFNVASNTFITANFITNPFPSLEGSYNGLFYVPGSVNPASAGFFSLRLTSSGSFSGRLLMGATAYNFSSVFSATGSAQVLASSGGKSLVINLQLDTTGQTGRILGDINGGTWDATLAADIAPVWTVNNPSTLVGSYTMALPWELGGTSYGSGAVTKQGVLNMTGTLADGIAFSASAPVSKAGQWPFYVYAASGKDSLLGWVSVSNGTNGLSGTNITWSKAASKGPLYAAGFVNNLALVGSTWLAPAKTYSPLSLADPVVVLNNGGLTDSLTINVAPETSLSFGAVNLSLSIKAPSGSFSGWFVNPNTGRKQTMSGVILQNVGQARGFFLGTNESGGVLLQSQ
jgi:hypothetical protein